LEEPVVEQDSGVSFMRVGTRIGIILIYCFRTPKQEVLHKHKQNKKHQLNKHWFKPATTTTATTDQKINKKVFHEVPKN